MFPAKASHPKGRGTSNGGTLIGVVGAVFVDEGCKKRTCGLQAGLLKTSTTEGALVPRIRWAGWILSQNVNSMFTEVLAAKYSRVNARSFVRELGRWKSGDT